MLVYYFMCYWSSNYYSLRCQMCDLHFRFEEDRTKTAVAIEDDRYFGQTDGRTDIHVAYIQLILYLSNAMHCIGQTDD